MTLLITTDNRGRTTIPGHKDQKFLVTEFEDGSLRLEPAVVVSKLQNAYDLDPEFRSKLDHAMAGTPVQYTPRRREIAE